MTTGISIEVDEKQRGGDSSTPPSFEKSSESDLLKSMKEAYVEFFESKFESQLPKDSANTPLYPHFKVSIDEQEYDVIFDFEFYGSLCDIYILEGWSGVLAIQEKIKGITKQNPQQLSGGVPDIRWEGAQPEHMNTWILVEAFFSFTQKMLALLIRETLINIERRVAEQMILYLSLANIEIQKAYGRYGIKPKEKRSDSLTKGHGGNVEITYSIDEESSKELYALLKPAVDEKNKYHKTLSELNIINTKIINAESISNFSPYPNSTYEPDIEKKKTLSKLKEESENYLKQLKSLITNKHPLALLILESMNEKTTQTEMENLFGTTVNAFREDFEKFGKEIDPMGSQTNALLPFNQTGKTDIDIQSFNVPPKGIEKFVMEEAVENVKNPQFLPLLSEETLIRIIDKEIIPTDSFEYVVSHHYLMALIQKLGEIEKKEKRSEENWKNLAKTSAGLSLASLMTPQSAPLAPVFRVGQVVADLALLAHTINSVTAYLRKYDENVRKILISQDGFTPEVIIELGEILSLRKEFYENLTEDVMLELLKMFGQNIPVLKTNLQTYNYLLDIDTLFAIGITG